MRSLPRVSRHAAFTLTLALAVGGCTSPQGELPDLVDPLEQNAVNALSMGLLEEADNALDIALNRYARQDDLEGQWRVRHMMAGLALSRSNGRVAREHSAEMSYLAEHIDNAAIRYESLLLAGRVNNDENAFRDALRLATSDVQRAVCHTYLGETERAAALVSVNTAGDPSDLAFIFYHHARAAGDSGYFLAALEQYRRADDSRGMADALVNLARLARGAGNREGAVRFADRAISILTAINDKSRADVIRAWQRGG